MVNKDYAKKLFHSQKLFNSVAFWKVVTAGLLPENSRCQRALRTFVGRFN